MKIKLKILITILFNLFCNSLFSQSRDILAFNEKEFTELLKKSCRGCEIESYSNKDFVQFKRNDSIITMSHSRTNNPMIYKKKGNYTIYYDFYPNLKIKSKTEFIETISRDGTFQVGVEKKYDEKGNITSEINREKGYYEDQIPLPKKTIWEIGEQLKKDMNFDIFADKNLFGIQFTEPIGNEKKIDFVIKKFLGDENDLLKLEIFTYDGKTGKFIESRKREVALPKGGLVHY